MVQSVKEQQGCKQVSNHDLGQLYKTEQVSSPEGKPLLKAFPATEDQILLPTAREEGEQDAQQGTGKEK